MARSPIAMPLILLIVTKNYDRIIIALILILSFIVIILILTSMDNNNTCNTPYIHHNYPINQITAVLQWSEPWSQPGGRGSDHRPRKTIGSFFFFFFILLNQSPSPIASSATRSIYHEATESLLKVTLNLTSRLLLVLLRSLSLRHQNNVAHPLSGVGLHLPLSRG